MLITKTLTWGLDAFNCTEKIANCILGKQTAKEFKEGRRLVGPQRCNRVFDFFKITTPVHVTSHEVPAQKAAPRAGAAKRAEAVKGAQSSGPSQPSKRQKTGSLVLASILESPTPREVAVQRTSPVVPPSTGPLAVVPIQVWTAEPEPLRPVIALPPPMLVAPSGLAKKSADPFDVPYSDAENSDDDVEVGAEAKDNGEEVKEEVLRLMPSASATKSSLSSSSDRSSKGKTASSPNASWQEEVAAKGDVEGERSEQRLSRDA